jgi:hypothetical protein
VTDPESDVAVETAADDEPAMSNEKAAEVVENDQALQEAGADSSPDSPSPSPDDRS